MCGSQPSTRQGVRSQWQKLPRWDHILCKPRMCLGIINKAGVSENEEKFLNKELDIKKHIKVPIMGKQECCGGSIHIFYSEVSFLFWIPYGRHGIITSLCQEPLKVLRSCPGVRSGRGYPISSSPHPSAVPSPPGSACLSTLPSRDIPWRPYYNLLAFYSFPQAPLISTVLIIT